MSQAHTQQRESLRVLREGQVVDRIGVHRATIWRWIAQGTFPAPIKLSSKSNGWIAGEVEEWFTARMAARAQ